MPLSLALFAAVALASGSASPKPPSPPLVDLGVLPPSARVQPPQAGDKPHPVVAHLIADHDVVAPGDTLRLGVYLEQLPGWHTYWRSPGDIGLPTTIEWKLPDGVKVVPYTFSAPQRFDYEGIVSYGYEDHSLLFSEITLPTDLPTGQVVLGAHASWLVCEANCIPGEADLSLPLSVGASSAPNAYAPLFDHFAAQHPQAPPENSFTVETVVDPPQLTPSKTFTATITVVPQVGAKVDPPTLPWPAFTPIVTTDVVVLDTKVEPRAEGGFIATLSGEVLPVDPPPAFTPMGGLVELTVGGKVVRTESVVDVPWAAAAAPEVAVAPATPPVAIAIPEVAPSGPLWTLAMLGLAFLGGLVLNIMPCVLPVLTLKLYGLIGHSHDSSSHRRQAGIAYTGGILVSFAVLAIVVIALKAAVGDVGWGFQFQYPAYVAALAAMVFAFGLSMFGVFEIPVVGGTLAADASAKDGMAGHFLTGVFATLLGTPCSAPFLGPAVAFAFSQNAPMIFLFMLVIGAGLAAPFLVVAFIPSLFRWMPAPGAWMDLFKKFMAFTLMATAIWLVSVLQAQIGPERTVGFLWFLGTLGVASFAFGHWGGIVESFGRQATAAAGALAITALGAWAFLDLRFAEAADCNTTLQIEGLDYGENIPWQPFSEQAVAQAKGHPVFIDFTAEWCVTCKATERLVINTGDVRAAMQQHGVIALKADWTRKDPVITEWLSRHGRAGVPFWLVLPADSNQPEIALPDAITSTTLIDALQHGAGRP